MERTRAHMHTHTHTYTYTHTYTHTRTHLSNKSPGQPIIYVIMWQHHMPDSGKHLGLCGRGVWGAQGPFKASGWSSSGCVHHMPCQPQEHAELRQRLCSSCPLLLPYLLNQSRDDVKPPQHACSQRSASIPLLLHPHTRHPPCRLSHSSLAPVKDGTMVRLWATDSSAASAAASTSHHSLAGRSTYGVHPALYTLGHVDLAPPSSDVIVQHNGFKPRLN